jgi:two-component system chemotaxis response regulator CheY
LLRLISRTSSGFPKIRDTPSLGHFPTDTFLIPLLAFFGFIIVMNLWAEEKVMANTILVVDDSSSVRQLVEFALKSRGYAVVTARNGREALEVLACGASPGAFSSGGSEVAQFGLVILDINMPYLDGLSLLKVMRECAECARLPVLMLTAERQEADRDRALALGAIDYIIKPFKSTELLERVATILAP